MTRPGEASLLEDRLEPAEQILYDSNAGRKPKKRISPWLALVVLAVAMIVLAACFGGAASGAVGGIGAGVGLLIWLALQNRGKRTILTDRQILYKPGRRAMVQQLSLSEIAAISIQGLQRASSFRVRMLDGRQFRINSYPDPQAFWDSLPSNLKDLGSLQTSRRLEKLHWTMAALAVPLLALMLAFTVLASMFLASLVPSESNSAQVTIFVLLFVTGIVLSVFTAPYGAAWFALLCWRRRIGREEAMTYFLGWGDPNDPSLPSRLSVALLPLGAWILRRVYGRPVDFDLGR